MSNFILKNPDCVFIHIKKTGGSSIRKGLWRENYEGPFFGYIPEKGQDLFKFAFVRNPVSRFLSAYKMFAYGTSHVRKLTNYPKIALDDFSKIVFNNSIPNKFGKDSTHNERIKHHTSPQTDPINCLHMADYVARYENYDNEIRYLCQILKKNILFIPRRNVTVSRTLDLNDRLCTQIFDFYEQDFKRLNYSLDKKNYLP